MTFRVGQKVVCVRPIKSQKEPFETYPEIGVVYTIRQIIDYPDGPAGLLLNEIRNPLYSYQEGFAECDFGADNFRPVQTTDISVFTAMLNPSKQGVDA